LYLESPAMRGFLHSEVRCSPIRSPTSMSRLPEPLSAYSAADERRSSQVSGGVDRALIKLQSNAISIAQHITASARLIFTATTRVAEYSATASVSSAHTILSLCILVLT